MSPTLLLDLALVLVLVLRAMRGWQMGATATLFQLAGLTVGALLGLWLAPLAVDRWLPGLAEPMPAVLVLSGTMLVALTGETILGGWGRSLRSRTRSPLLWRLDGAFGALASMLVLSIVVTLLGGAVRPALPTEWASTMNRSRVVAAMDRLTPPEAARLSAQFTDRLTEAGFPRVFSGLSREPVLPVPAPDGDAARTEAVRLAGSSVMKITTEAPSCGRSQAGSGWVVAPERVVTNAHVVAGARTVLVQAAGQGLHFPARVVAFDPDLDLAVLAVDDLRSRPLPRAGQALGQRADAVVAGFPRGGDYTLRAARVRDTVSARGDDIYGDKGVVREVYALAGTVVPGNSGGPLLDTRGRVAGTVFARSLVDSDTAYALTDEAADQLLDSAARLQAPVSTGGCTRG